MLFLGESFSRVNALGLCVLVGGVFLFNYSKYRRITSGQARTGKPPGAASHREDAADGDEEATRLMPRMPSGALPAMQAPASPTLHRLDLESGQWRVNPRCSEGAGKN